MVGRITLILMLTMMLSSMAFGSATGLLRPDSVEQALLLQDGEQAQISSMYVDMILGSNYIIVRDTTAGSVPLAVYTNGVQVSPFSTLLIRGTMATVQSRRVLISDEIYMYTTSRGDPAPPIGWMQPEDWPYMARLSQPATTLSGDQIPPVPDIPAPAPYTPPSAHAGSVASAKLEIAAPETSTPQAASVQSFAVRRTLSSTPPQLSSGPVEITGAVVTAVFYEQTPKVFYIQSTDCPSGIKVIPSIAVPIEVGNLVDIKGMSTCGSSDAEARVIADSVTCTGSHAIPNAIGMSQRQTVGSAFGIQPELYKKTSSPTETVGGLNAVGVRVRVWGNIVSGSGTTYWLDDGSNLKSTVGSEEKTGIRLIFATAPSPAYTHGQNVAVTGILGAEMSDDATPCPVPVVRIPADTTRPVKYVKPGGTGNGSSWTNAYGSVQSAIDAAYAANPKCEVWVAAGTYNQRITLKDGVAVYGGFAGLDTETKRDQRDWVTNATILDGQQGGCVVTSTTYLPASTRLDGFTIQHGKYEVGGGLTIYGSPVIANNIITNNSGKNYYGGAIYCSSPGPTFYSNLITSNTGYQGPIYCEMNVSPLICNNTITHNTCWYFGGILTQYGSPIIANNVISYNTATHYNGGGGGIICTNGTTTITGNTITNNSVQNGGGGIVCGGGSQTILNNTISNNSSTGGSSYGGGITCGNCILTISGNTISGNAAYNGGGGIYCHSVSSGTISNNTITNNNQYGPGAGILCDSGSPTISSNTITGNVSQTGGGGIYCTAGSPTVTDNEIAGNTAPYGGGVACISGSSSTLIVNNTVSGNSALYGGGVFCQGGSPTIRANMITANYATGTGEGGGMCCILSCLAIINANTFDGNDGATHGGGISLEDHSDVEITNNVFVGNHAAGPGGGGVQALDSSPKIINNTFVANWVNLDPVNGTGGDGGAVLLRKWYIDVNALIINNIFYKNRAWDWDQPLTSTGNSVACKWNATATVLYCGAFSDLAGSDTTTYNYLSTTPGEGCYVQRILQGDPLLFVDENNSDFQLRLPGPPYTPIDKGRNPGMSPYDRVPTIDHDGNGRPVDIVNVGNDGGNAVCDMGAYERQQ